MKIAFCVQELRQIENVGKLLLEWNLRGLGAEADFFCSKEKFLKLLSDRFYDMIIIFMNGESAAEEERIRQIRKKGHDSICSVIYDSNRPALSKYDFKYTGQFNGRKYAFNMRDICYLESYDRKTSVVIGGKKMRITARINEEEDKLSGKQFVRINRWFLANMHHIKSVAGDAVQMSNGEILYVSSKNKKVFLARYQEYMMDNFSVI